jgi:TonB family protein
MLRLIPLCIFTMLIQGMTSDASTVGTEEMKKRIVKSVECPLPQEAIDQRVTGRVLIEVVVDKEGKVEATKVINGHPLLDKAATDCVKQWKFRATGERYKGQVAFSFKVERLRLLEGKTV